MLDLFSMKDQLSAKQQMASRSKYSTSHVKRLIGTSEKISIVNSLGKTIETTPEKISSILLKKIANIASDVTGSDVTNAVIAVPHDYNDAQKKSILQAAELAKLNVLQLISETSAIALAYGIDEQIDGNGHYCIVDVDAVFPATSCQGRRRGVCARGRR